MPANVADLSVMVADLVVVVALLGGTFFMFVAALGLYRLPDIYNRMHAATKGATLGMVGLLLASTIYLPQHHDVPALGIIMKAALIVMFMFIANPVGAHLLGKAAHLDGAPMWTGTLKDELEDD